MWYNGMVEWVLKSPLRGVMDGSVMLLEFHGRKSGKTYKTPLEYVRMDDGLALISQRTHTWWRNMLDAKGGVPVTMYLQGQTRRGMARAIVEETELVREIAALQRKRPAYAKYLNLALDEMGAPTAESLANAAKKYVIVKIQLLD